MADFAKYMENLKNMLKETSDINALEKNILTTQIVPLQSQIPKRKLKLLLVSHHISSSTKNGKLSLNMMHQFSKNTDWLEIIHYAKHATQSPILNKNREYPTNVKVINTLDLNANEPHGYANICSIIIKEAPDIVLFYDDMVNIIQYIELIKTKEVERFFRIWAFIDPPSMFQPPSVVETINREMDMVFVHSNEWKKPMKSSGIIRPIHNIRFNVDDKIRKLPKDFSRKSINLPNEAFVFIGNGSNCEKNRLDTMIIGFVKLIEKYPSKNILLLLCCDKGDRGGFPIFEIFRNELKKNHLSSEIFGSRMIVASNSTRNFTDDEMNLFYNSADAGINCTEGSSFNLSAFEQMSLGIPQIVSDVMAHSDYCNTSNSILVQPIIRLYDCLNKNPVSGDKFIINSEDLCVAMEKYLLHDDFRHLHGSESLKTMKSYSVLSEASTKLIESLKYSHKEL